MRAPNGAWLGWALGDNSTTDFTVRSFKQFAKRMYASYMGDLDDTNLFDAKLQTEIGEMQDKLVTGGHLSQFIRGVLDLPTEYASGFKVKPPPGPDYTCVAFSINGAGSTWFQGYPYDIGEALDKSRCLHQPIGYDTNPVPMQTGVNDGVTEFIRQLDLPRPQFGGRNCTTIPWLGIFYSMGALVGMTVLMRILYGDLQRFKSTYMGSSAFGNPMRQANHVYPGGIPVDGEGIATTDTYVIPDCHWDFVSSKGMTGGSGDDLYAKVGGADELLENSALSLADLRAVWRIVDTGNPLNLAVQIGELVLSPSFSKIEGAFSAAWNAAQFFIIGGLRAHTEYQAVQTRAGDTRSAWDQALWHSADLVTRLPVGAAG